MDIPNSNDELMEHLEKIVITLVIDKGVPERSINNHIRRTIEKAAKHLPKIPVLINTCHGGYEISDDFSEFLDDQTVADDNYYMIKATSVGNGIYKDRIISALAIPEYGRQIAQTYPYLLDMMKIYQASYKTIAQLLACANRINNNEETLEEIDKRYEHIKEYALNLYTGVSKHMKNKPSPYLLETRKPKLFLYSKEELLSFIDNVDLAAVKAKIRDELEKDINTSEWALLPATIQNSIKDYLQSYGLTPQPTSPVSFIDFIKANEQLLLEMWRHQLTITQRNVMCYVTYLYNNDKVAYNYWLDLACEIPEANATESLGLLCASGEYAALDIIYVSPYVDFRIKEYDGLESIS